MDIIVGSKNKPRSIWGIILFLVFLIIASMVTGFLAIIVLKIFQLDTPDHLPYIMPLSGFIATLVVTKFAIDIKKWSFNDMGMAISLKWIFDLSRGFLAGGALILLVAFTVYLLGGFRLWFGANGGGFKILSGLFYFVTVALNEEFLFRGFLFRFSLASYGKWLTLISTSILFAIVHFWNPGIASLSGVNRIIIISNLILSGLLFGLLYLKAGNLAIPIGVHIAWNWVQGYILGFRVSGIEINGSYLVPHYTNRPDWLTGGNIGLEGSLVTTIVIALSVILIELYPSKLEIGK